MSSGFFTCSDGAKLSVFEEGAADPPVTVVLVHCYALGHGEWDRLLPELANELDGPARVLRYDQRGYGESDGVERGTATLAQLGDDLAELITERVPLGPVVLVGHSMGGMAIMAMAERHERLVAERIAGVAFVSTACTGMGGLSFGLPGPLATIAHGLERACVRLLSAARLPVLWPFPQVLEPFVRRLVFGEGADGGDVAHVARLLAACRPVTMLLFRPDFDAHDRRDALANLACSPAPPASTVLVGSRDRMTPPRYAAEIAEWLPGSRFVLLEGAGHMLPHERAAEVAAEVGLLVRAAAGMQAVEAS